jgi:serine/threonine protein kinase
MEHPGFIDRFEREAKVVAKLEHPNIVPIYDFSEHEDRPYLVLKYVRGETLKARLEKSKLTYKESRHIFRVISSALSYAHQEGVLHRDVKPSNVLIEKNGGIFLADFGLARIAQTSQTTLSGQMMMGTPHYISPEQAKGLGDLDSGTDIYSLGVMMYELLVGEVPYQADTPFSVIHDHIYSPLPLPMEVNPDLNEEIQRALLKALAKKREDRYQSVSEMMAVFLRAFEALIKEHPSPGEAPTLALKPTKARKTKQPSQITDKAEDTAVLDEKQAKPARKGIPSWVWWMAAPAAVLICLASTVISSALEPPGPDLITAETLTQEAGVNIPPANGEIPSLIQQIQENPTDPFLQYQLGVAYLDADRPQQAREAFKRAYQLADDNPAIILEFGDKLTEIDIWTYAAYSYLKAEQLGAPLPPTDMKNRISEALYYAAYEDFVIEVLSRNEDIELDPAQLQLLESRRALLNGRIEVAERLVDQVMRERPDLLEAYLLKSDVLFALDRFEEARDLLLELEQFENLPEWIKEELRLQT